VKSLKNLSSTLNRDNTWIVFGKILSQFDKFETGVYIGFRSISKKGKFTKEGSKKVVSPLG